MYEGMKNSEVSRQTALTRAIQINRLEMATLLFEAGARCRYERSGLFNTTCKLCGDGKKGRWHS